ncbi:metalloprotease [Ilyomonas limi]|uniref:Metalloprotease n=1 Tax=Ilyomonas limi TaxID=2575867 RepID=A0A4U3KV41_9BACT|nr:neutral zinc metallopeptidase [Ilyomonas limi]TKK65689.1 metalloprotease [Ilyomonas limi]
MLWQGRRESSNVEDRRGFSGRGMAVGGGLGTMVIAFIVYLLGGNPNQVLNNNSAQSPTQQSAPANDETTHFVRTILADTEDIWSQLFENMGRTYADPHLVLFSGSTQSACGYASQATGPFYCPGDSKVYLDVSFFDELQNRFGAEGGDFADAYVIAHEVGHHVQHLLGITDQVDAQRGRISEKEQNELSVRLELQADFLAGVWAHYEAQQQAATDPTRKVIQEGDIEEALNAASAIGDDRLQKQTQGYVVPDAFTHGTSAQRVRWFKKGFETGDINQGDTFNAANL